MGDIKWAAARKGFGATSRQLNNRRHHKKGISLNLYSFNKISRRFYGEAGLEEYHSGRDRPSRARFRCRVVLHEIWTVLALLAPGKSHWNQFYQIGNFVQRQP